ncbi:MAG: gluconokinase [Microcoleus sp. PH2017_17_BER_D_A]|nr:gluconokinase [Microcoleus sp. PH2017_17_BER_D_A]
MIIMVMGVSGSGKTTVGKLLAESLNWDFSDADDFHPPGNIEKMSRGIPLEDADRLPWLLHLQGTIDRWLLENKNVVLACSGLKASYREMLFRDKQRMKIVYLKGDFELFAARLKTRENHYMKEPENAIIIDASQPLEVIVRQIINYLMCG